MSRFYGTLNAGRATATKCGHPADGISATARGWDIGGEVSMRAAGDTDTVHLEVIPGSNDAGHRLHVGTFTRDGSGVYTCTGGALADLIAAAREVMVDLDLHASTHGPGPDRRRDDLAAALLRFSHE